MTDGKGAYGSNTSIFDRTGSCLPKIACIPQPYMCRPPACACGGIMYLGHTIRAAGSLLLLTRRPLIALETRPLFLSWMATMQLTQLNRECLLHLFSFLDKDSRRSLSLTCHRLHEVFLDSRLWNLLHFSSPCELKRDNFVLGPSLHYLTVCWHSSRVLQVCNIEDWLKSSFQKDICSKHESLVSTFLARVCHMCPNLLSLTLSGCGHITDLDVISVLQSCRRLRSLHLENCVRITDCSLQGVAAHGHSLEKLTVDFCRNITQAGLQAIRDRRPGIRLSSERSADMIPDSKPEERMPLRRTLPKHLLFS